MIVVFEELTQPGTELSQGAMFPQEDMLPLDGPPESLDENVVEHSPATVHADRHAALLQTRRECLAGELNSLIRVEDLWPLPRQGFLQGLNAEAAFQTVR